jgi:hypothetical protein
MMQYQFRAFNDDDTEYHGRVVATNKSHAVLLVRDYYGPLARVYIQPCSLWDVPQESDDEQPLQFGVLS